MSVNFYPRENCYVHKKIAHMFETKVRGGESYRRLSDHVDLDGYRKAKLADI